MGFVSKVSRFGAIAIVGTIVGLSLGLTPAIADGKPLSKTQVEQIVRNYLLKNPEILIEMSQILDAKQQSQSANKFSENLQSVIFELENGDGGGVMGNPNGTTIIYEFSDYNCPFCKQMGPLVKKALEENGNVKVILKEFPILGASSKLASTAALAAKMQGKYQQAHFALIAAKGRLSENKIYKLLGAAGIDIDRLKKDMKSPAIAQAIAKNLEIGQLLGINGTPAFIASQKLYPGALSQEQFAQMLKAAEKKPN